MSTGNWFLDLLDATTKTIQVMAIGIFGIMLLALFGIGIADLFHKAKEKRARKKREKEEAGRKLLELEEKIRKIETRLFRLDGSLELSLDDVYECLDKNQDECRHRFERLERQMRRYEMAIDATTEFNQQRLKAAAKRRKRG